MPKASQFINNELCGLLFIEQMLDQSVIHLTSECRGCYQVCFLNPDF